MELIGWMFKQLYEKILLIGGAEPRVRYLRRKGIRIGENCNINTMNFSTEPYLIELGNHVVITNGVKFVTHDGAASCFKELEGEIFGRIKIGNNVFIGLDSIIMLNTTIDDNCVIGAGSVVRGHFAENSVIVGNPAKVILNRNIQGLLFRHNPGFVMSKNLSPSDQKKMVKQHFGIE